MQVTPSQIQLNVDLETSTNTIPLTARSTALQDVQRQLLLEMKEMEDQSHINHRLLSQYTHDIDQYLYENKE